MLKRRLIPVLYLKDGWMVRSEAFSLHQYIGAPVPHVERMVQWNVDELIVLDIGTEESRFDHHRTDYRARPVTTLLEFVECIGVECSIPLTFGGRIRTLDDIELRILNGADKVAVNTQLARDPSMVRDATKVFGSQALVASVDYRLLEDRAIVHVDRGRESTGRDVVDWVRQAVDLGVGEILLNAIDRDGMAKGFDLETVAAVAEAVSVPVIACGGAGNNQHFLDVLDNTAVQAVAAGNIFHFKENAYPAAKAFLKTHVEDIR